MTDFNNAWALTLPELRQNGRYLPERTVFAQQTVAIKISDDGERLSKYECTLHLHWYDNDVRIGSYYKATYSL